MKILLATLSLLLFAGTSRADSVWNYQGQFIFGCDCSLSGSVTLDGSGQAELWDFTDGLHDLTNANSSGTVLLWGANPSLYGWFVHLTAGPVDMLSKFDPFIIPDPFSGDPTLISIDQVQSPEFGGWEGGFQGVWTDPAVATPEPGTLALIGVGFAGLLARKRLRKRNLLGF